MVVSLEEAITILSKWKDDSATILVAAESPFRLHLRDIHDPGVDWTMGIRGRVAQAEFSPGTKGAKAGIVVFEGSSGNLSLSIGGCAFVYEEPREAQPDILEEAEATTISSLSIFFPSNEAFLAYELRE